MIFKNDCFKWKEEEDRYARMNYMELNEINRVKMKKFIVRFFANRKNHFKEILFWWIE